MSLQNELAAIAAARRSLNGIAAALTYVQAVPDESIIHIPIAAAIAGDNIIIPSPGRRMLIVEIFLWNGITAQTLQIKNGPATLLVQISALAAGAGFVLGFNGSSNPHFVIDPGNALVLNTSAGALVDGFAKYRIS